MDEEMFYSVGVYVWNGGQSTRHPFATSLHITIQKPFILR